jgi:hypothetical protein
MTVKFNSYYYRGSRAEALDGSLLTEQRLPKSLAIGQEEARHFAIIERDERCLSLNFTLVSDPNLRYETQCTTETRLLASERMSTEQGVPRLFAPSTLAFPAPSVATCSN